MAWRCRFLTARRNQRGHVIVHPTHWLISTQWATTSGVGITSRVDWPRDDDEEKKAPAMCPNAPVILTSLRTGRIAFVSNF